jgi:hypothetical protein
MNEQKKDDLFWDLAEPMLITGKADKGTMMGFPCLRVQGKFFASLERDTNNLIIKLPAERVKEVVSSGAGVAFAPNGRIFREWVTIEQIDEENWRLYLQEARSFVLSST